jgi:hypothetical protein
MSRWRVHQRQSPPQKASIGHTHQRIALASPQPGDNTPVVHPGYQSTGPHITTIVVTTITNSLDITFTHRENNCSPNSGRACGHSAPRSVTMFAPEG